MVGNIAHKTEILMKYMGEFINLETAGYINELLKSYHSYCEGIDDAILEMLYYKAFTEAIEVAENQLKEEGIDFEVLTAAHVIEE